MRFRYISQRRQMIKAYASGIGKTAVIYPAAFLLVVALAVLMLSLVFYVREVYDASGIQVGAMFGAWWLCYAASCISLRPLTDSFRPRMILPVSTFAMSMFALGIRLGGCLAMVYVCCGLMGLSSGLFWPPLMGWLSTGLEGPQLNKVLGRFNVSWSVGGMIGAPLGGWLSQYNVVLPIYVASALLLMTSALIMGATLALPGVRRDKETAITSAVSNGDRAKETRLRYAAWLGVFTIFLVSGVISQIWPVSARDDLRLAKVAIGLLLFGRSLSNTLALGLMGHTDSWHYKGGLMLRGHLYVLVALAAMAWAGNTFTLVAGLALVGLVTGMSYSYSIFHGVAGSANRAARMAVHESLLSLGVLNGGVIGGLIYDRFSMMTVYAVLAGVVLASLAAQAAICFWARKVEAPT